MMEILSRSKVPNLLFTPTREIEPLIGDSFFLFAVRDMTDPAVSFGQCAADGGDRSDLQVFGQRSGFSSAFDD